MSQNRLDTVEWDGGSIDTLETTTNESVRTECEALALCRFERPETYTFETYSGLRNSADRLVVDVVEVTETGAATIDLRYEMATRTITDTITGSVTDDGLWMSLGLSLAGGMFVSRPTRLMLPYYMTHDEITVGEVWSPVADTTKQPSQTEITGRTTHAGVECYTFRTVGETYGNETVTTGSLSPELQLVPQMVVTDSAGEASFATRLVEYERP